MFLGLKNANLCLIDFFLISSLHLAFSVQKSSKRNVILRELIGFKKEKSLEGEMKIGKWTARMIFYTPNPTTVVL